MHYSKDNSNMIRFVGDRYPWRTQIQPPLLFKEIIFFFFLISTWIKVMSTYWIIKFAIPSRFIKVVWKSKTRKWIFCKALSNNANRKSHPKTLHPDTARHMVIQIAKSRMDNANYLLNQHQRSWPLITWHLWSWLALVLTERKLQWQT